jgi:hypothetical protein
MLFTVSPIQRPASSTLVLPCAAAMCVKALKVRVQKHVRRAVTENKDWNLCKSIREHGTLAHTYGLVEIIRGRKPAHARERELIRMYNPALNSH